MKPQYRPFPLPFGFLLSIAIRTRPLGVGVVFWTPREQDEAKLVRGNTHETVRKAA